MAKEIEHKFIIEDRDWIECVVATLDGERITQGYLTTYSKESPSTVRVRIKGDMAFLTIKGPQIGITKDEFEYEIPVHDANLMLALCESVLDKTRYEIPGGRRPFEIDEFHGKLSGLVMAEIELDSEDEEFWHPSWLGRAVSKDMNYTNSTLAKLAKLDRHEIKSIIPEIVLE